VMADPRDIALAIRLKSSSTQNGDEREREMDRMEDLFDEIGMEYMDESSLPEDDDERRMSIHYHASLLDSGENTSGLIK